MKVYLVFATLLFLSLSKILPVAVFHGMGDACKNRGFKNFVKQLSDQLDGAYVTCIESGGGGGSFDHSMIEQSEQACQLLKQDENLRGDISVVGLSQGALVGRYIIQQCDFDGQVKRYLGIGGPQMGAASSPNCFRGVLCRPINSFIRKNAYKDYYQENFGPAQMYRDAKSYDHYLYGNRYLPYLNNQRVVNPKYKNRTENLDLMYLTQFAKDTVVDPPSSEWFSFWDKTMKHLIPLQQQPIYENLGLKTLEQQGKLKYLKLNGNHLEFSNSDVTKYYIPALKGETIPNQMESSGERDENEEFHEFIQF